jgi:hypothetical protein
MTKDDFAPGTRLRRFAERTFDSDTVERVIRPALADVEYECAGDAASRLVRLRAYWGLSKALAVCLVVQWARWGRPAAQGVAWRMLIILPIVTGVVLVPAIRVGLSGQALAPQQFLLTSLPGAFIPSLPIAFFFAVAFERHAVSLRRLVPVVFAMALVCTLVMMVVTFAVVPHANHSYSLSVNEQLKAAGRPAPVSFGAGEWPFAELVAKASGKSSERDTATARKVLSLRLAASTLPIVLGFVALGIAGYERQHSLVNGIWILMLYFAALRAVAGSSQIAPSLSRVWLVNGVFCLAGLWLVWLRPTPLKDDDKGFVLS